MDLIVANAGDVFIFGIVVMILGYMAQCSDARPEGLPLVRHPAALLVRAVKALWRNRALVGLFLAVDVVSAAVYSRIRSMAYDDFPVASFLDHVRSLPERAASTFQRPWWQLSVGLPTWGNPFSGGMLSVLLFLALAVALTIMGVRRPRWLPPALQRRAPLAAILAWGACAGQALVTAGLLPRGSAWLGYGQGLLTGVGALIFLLTAPWVALGFSLALQIAAGRQASLRRAIIGALRTWPAFLVLLAVEESHLLLPLVTRAHPAAFPAVEAVGRAVMLLIAAGFMVPWLILAEDLGLAAALARQVELWRTRGADLGVFLVRYFTVMFLPGLLLGVVVSAFRGTVGADAVIAALQALWRMVQAVILGMAYLELRKLERRKPAAVAHAAMEAGNE